MITLDNTLETAIRLEAGYSKKLSRLGIKTVGDLFYHFPSRYEDYSQITPIYQISPAQTATVIGTVSAIKSGRSWKKRMIITEALIQDETGYVRAVWFNQRFIATAFKKGQSVRLSGKVQEDKKGLYLANPAVERSSREPTQTGRLVPVYPETEGLTSKWLRWKIGELLKRPISFDDPISQDDLSGLNLPDLKKALYWIHFPATEDEYLVAQKRFAFEEMLLLQLQSLSVKLLRDKESAAAIPFDEILVKNFVSTLPFTLTDAQRKAAFQILKDLEKERPMNRLLNGDVGSGKTVVAALAALEAASAGYQVAIMAPTEVLARQHFESFSSLFSKTDVRIGLITSSYKMSNHESRIMNHEKSGKKHNSSFIIKNSDIVIGTHALIQKDIAFQNLALVVIDEQHRFGVAQRAYLQQRTAEINDGLPEKIPHLLSMTATPIPRSLALAFFGNLDLSLLDEMPKNRKPIITKIVLSGERQKVYSFIEREIEKGRQVFVILPLVEESKIMTEIKAAVAEHKRLSEKIFPHRKIGLLHGRLKAKEKEQVMQRFKDKKLEILVATAVVEVGIDVPNATVMLIEDADRFGLAQLHQFRGRVGRSEMQSYCFLFSESPSNTRLKVLEQHASGFDVAEKDLKLRGPGEFLGTAQSGLPDIAMENLANVKLIEIARQKATAILSADPTLIKHPLLKQKIKSMNRNVHLE